MVIVIEGVIVGRYIYFGEIFYVDFSKNDVIIFVK